ncbi:hypothetical protein A0J57_17115 [Sphingobium sp. 22B]|uniref:DUF4198 domain-containing protein n=1 Tax=unclassified Sphingobium TaxID=2611147 RepID=UPI000782494D|nr:MULTISPECIES: DUF4198 domain-containing protein [unclassified Sphingobium]KXU31508.1 hypothetical protein AXW74_12525 [Sphingobium sp. AM]KYC31162.1 hypothetical protein A0J57_17115 [Sphingobium sp. 22B]OAP31163.1 hypothetical protein A8O16_15020 [Sphingobium sp. 20006FA]
MRRLPVLAVLALLTAGAAQRAIAHGMYVAPRHGTLGIVVGFSTDDDAYPVHKVASSVSYDAGGKATPATLLLHSDHATISAPASTAALVTTVDYGFYARPAGGKWKEMRKSVMPGAGEGLHAIKYNVRIMGLGQQGKSHDLGLEIVPLADPMIMKLGDKLPLQVLLNGKPLKGVRLTENFLGDDTILTAPTDADGKTVTTLRASKLNVISIEYDAHVSGEPDVDFYRYFVTLDFDLPHTEPE